MLEVERVRDAFHRAAFGAPDLPAALALSTDDCVLATLPTGTGALGRAALAAHLRDEVHPHLPVDLAWRRVSRTVDRWRVAEEATVSFTFDRPLPWLLPDVVPTGRREDVLAVSVVTVHRGRVSSCRTLWDLAGSGRRSGAAVDGGPLLRWLRANGTAGAESCVASRL